MAGIQQQTYEARRQVAKEQLLENSANSGAIKQMGRLGKAAKHQDFKQKVQKQTAKVKFLGTGRSSALASPRGDFGFGGIQRGGQKSRGSLDLNPKSKGKSVIAREHGMAVLSAAKKWTTGGYMDEGSFGKDRSYFFEKGRPSLQKDNLSASAFGVVTGLGHQFVFGGHKMAGQLKRAATERQRMAHQKTLKKRKTNWESQKAYGEEAVKKVEKHLQERADFAASSPLKSLVGVVFGGKAGSALTGLFGGKENG